MDLVGSHAVKLDTPPGIHPVFHVDLLRQMADDPLPRQTQRHQEPTPVVVDGHEELEVEDIVRHRRRGRGYQVPVRWRGLAQPTWEPLSALAETFALDRYEEQQHPPWEVGG